MEKIPEPAAADVNAALDRASATVAAARAVMFEVSTKLAGMHAIELRALTGVPSALELMRAARVDMLEDFSVELASLCRELKLEPPATLLTIKGAMTVDELSRLCRAVST